MIKKLSILILFGSLLFSLKSIFPRNIEAINDPLNVSNNKFGIHILNDTDLEDADFLVNSSGGDWGYVTLVIRSDEWDHQRWQEVFDNMRRLHLIPIVRIATKMTEKGWEKPNFDEIDGWVSFLGELNWVVQNRYITLGNEPNHASEWGGEISPSEYAKYLKTFSEKLKGKSSDFFILNAGFDASSYNSKTTQSEEQFLRKMVEYNPNILTYIDGWSSHSYPNPDFSGTQDDKGRGTVETFKWELTLLKTLGLNKKLPVFITETGWRHDKDGQESDAKDLQEVTERLIASYDIAWKDDGIVAITPFLLNYQDPPFDIFSWKKPDGTFYDIYGKVKNLPKIKGVPIQSESVDVLSVIFPPIIPSGGKFTGLISIQNNGQGIWNGEETIYTKNKEVEMQISPIVILSDIEPGEKTPAIVKIKRKP